MGNGTKIWIEGTIMAALAMVLSLIPLDFGSSFSISLGQIPLTIFAIRRGWKPGLMAGLVWGLLHFPLGKVWFLSVLQVLIEYPFAFTFVGFAGLYANKIHLAIRNGSKGSVQRLLVQATFTGAFARYLAFPCRLGLLGRICSLGDETLAFLSGNEYRQRTCYGNRHGNYLTNCLSNIPRGICT